MEGQPRQQLALVLEHLEEAVGGDGGALQQHPQVVGPAGQVVPLRIDPVTSRPGGALTVIVHPQGDVVALLLLHLEQDIGSPDLDPGLQDPELAQARVVGKQQQGPLDPLLGHRPAHQLLEGLLQQGFVVVFVALHLYPSQTALQDRQGDHALFHGLHRDIGLGQDQAVAAIVAGDGIGHLLQAADGESFRPLPAEFFHQLLDLGPVDVVLGQVSYPLQPEGLHLDLLPFIDIQGTLGHRRDLEGRLFQSPGRTLDIGAPPLQLPVGLVGRGARRWCGTPCQREQQQEQQQGRSGKVGFSGKPLRHADHGLPTG